MVERRRQAASLSFTEAAHEALERWLPTSEPPKGKSRPSRAPKSYKARNRVLDAIVLSAVPADGVSLDDLKRCFDDARIRVRFLQSDSRDFDIALRRNVDAMRLVVKPARRGKKQAVSPTRAGSRRVELLRRQGPTLAQAVDAGERMAVLFKMS